MNKAELIAELAPRIGTSHKTALAAVDEMIDIIVRTVEKDESVIISGFGVFEKKQRAARVARNPRTGESLTVAATSIPVFRPGHNFKDIINGTVQIPAEGLAVRRKNTSVREDDKKDVKKKSNVKENSKNTSKNKAEKNSKNKKKKKK